jgi:hypothetical protein
MPRYTQGALVVDTLQASGDVSSDVDAIAMGDFKYGANKYRYLRIPAYSCKLLTPQTVTYPSPASVAGRPIYVTFTGATHEAFFYKQINLPFGAQVQMVSIIHRQPGTNDNSTITTRRINPTGDTQLQGLTVTHTGDAVALSNFSSQLSGSEEIDDQLTSDPSVASDFYMIELEFKMKYDSVLGGSQDHYFYGFILKYMISSLGGAGAVLRERT